MLKTVISPATYSFKDNYQSQTPSRLRLQGTVHAPSGKTLGSSVPKAVKKETPDSKIGGKMILLTILMGVLGYLYISHVFYTQKLHAEVNTLRTQFEQTRIDYMNTRLTYERMTGPADVYERAKSIGLVDGGPADLIISVK